MSWIQQVESSMFLASLLARQDRVGSIILHEVRVVRDGPAVWLRFDVDAVPDQFPEKWRMLGYNKAQAQLVAVPVIELHIDGADTQGNAEIVIESLVLTKRLTIRCAQSKIWLVTPYVAVDKVSGYLSEA